MEVRQLLWTVVVATALAAPAPPTPHPDVYDPQTPPKYEFEYGVDSADPAYGAEATKYGQQEARDGPSTAGSYQVLLPDSRTQTVFYTVDGDGGYVASVEYDGEAAADASATYGAADGGAAFVVPVYKPRSRDEQEDDKYKYAPARSYEGATRKAVKALRGEGGRKKAQEEGGKSYAPESGIIPTYGAKVSRGSAASYDEEPTPTYAPATTRAPAPKSVYITSRPAYVAPPPSPSPTYAPSKTQPTPPAPAYPAYKTQTTAPPAPLKDGAEYKALLWPSEPAATPETPIFAGEKLRLARVPPGLLERSLFRSEVERTHPGEKDGGRAHRGGAADPADDAYVEPDKATLEALKILEAEERKSNFGSKIQAYSDSAEQQKPTREYRPVFATSDS